MALFEAIGLRKRFGGVEALRGVDLAVRPAEVLGLMGDNGAGKSTLIKIICGAYRPDAGELRMDGEPVSFRNPRDAVDRGVSVVFQDLGLVDTRDVATNVFLGREPHRRGLVDARRMRREAREVLDTLRIHISSVRLPVGGLSGGQRQSIAIARAVHEGGRLVLLDEPTAALGPEQQRNVLDLIGDLRSQGKSVVMVSHNVDHVLAVADRVAVMRGGVVAGVREISETTAAEIVGLILGDTASSLLTDVPTRPE
ncbi:ATP-binding cassette domain-containing protein [Actinoallomurus purpureus]|jgi:ABC-type sugar transport system ATPase subunit|uniref:ATP-binding cassette domain-containing protein n=1 Tax=Actinoallomurus purpureus TaxID=478114 RepID=UPI002093EED2|nr:ATP-binding cassette domain-containing protein [Actinoallomurus purpureus]MCO6004211.1 ATP-binding cassette domain-containing protein [Actinoallomurus purpureus]